MPTAAPDPALTMDAKSYRRALRLQGSKELQGTGVFWLIGACVVTLFAGGFIGYLFDPKGSPANSTAAGIGTLVGVVIFLIAVTVIGMTGGWSALIARLRHQPPLRPVHTFQLEPGEDVRDALARLYKKSGRSDIRWGWGFILVGLVGAVVLLGGGLHERSLTQSEPGWLTTTGTVQNVQETSCKGGCEWIFDVSFTVPGRGTVRFQPPNATVDPGVGSSVKVAYSPANPSAAHDLSDTANDAAGLLVLAPVALVVGLLCGIPTLLAGRHRLKLAGTFPTASSASLGSREQPSSA